MKLRTRLIIAFIVVVLLPIILLAVTFTGIGQYQFHILEKNFGIQDDLYDAVSNPVKLYSKVTEKVYKQLEEEAEKNPVSLENQTYLANINKELLGKSSFLIVRKDDDIYYSGDQKLTDELTGLLPNVEKNEKSDGETYLRDQQILIKQLYFDFSDGSKGNVFIITQAADMIPQVKSVILQMIISLIVILFLTGIGMVSWIYSGLIAPLKQLSDATKRIAEGDLDFTIETRGQTDEIESLCVNFEEMRKRLKESAEEKVQNENENRQLISNITHDLKTPVTAIKGYAEGIMDGVAVTQEKHDKYIRTIYNKAADMDRLISELTFYSSIDTNRIPYNFTKLSIGEYFLDCVDELEMDLESKNIQLTYSNELQEETYVIADPVQMRKVVNNIIGNSAKYIDKEAGMIDIRIRDAEEFIVIEIKDNGKGISTKDLPYIFDRFYRSDTSRNSSKGGSGIGLSIVKKIVEDHGGRIWAASKPDVGTTMFLELRKYNENQIEKEGD